MGICLSTIYEGIAILTLQVGRIYRFIITIDIGFLEQLGRRLQGQTQQSKTQKDKKGQWGYAI